MTRKWYESAKLIDVVYDDREKQEPVSKVDAKEEIIVLAAVPVEFARLGFGANTFSGKIKGRALHADDDYIDKGDAAGQEKLFNLNLIKSKHELNERMEVSASASYSGLFSASAKTKFANEQKLNYESVYLLVSVFVTNGRMMLNAYQPSDDFANYLKNDPVDWDGFLRRYGNQFVFSIVTGGEFYALYEFHTQSIEQKKAIEVAVKGSGWGFSAESDFKKELDKIDTDVEITCKLYIRGGKGNLPEIKDDQIIAAALMFPKAVDPESGAPVDYKAETEDYDVVEGFPGFPKDIRDNMDRDEEICNEIVEELSIVEELTQMLDSQGDLDDITASKLNEAKKDLSRVFVDIAKNPMKFHEMPSEPIEEINSIKIEKIWKLMPGELTQISVGSHQHVWGVGADQSIHRWSSIDEKWETITGELVNVSVGADGTTWGVNGVKGGQIFHWVNSSWAQMGGALKLISVGSNNHVWGMYGIGNVSQLRKNSWETRTNAETGTFDLLSVGSDGTVMLLKENRVFKWNKNDESYEPFDGQLSHISVGNAKNIWGIDTESRVVYWDGKAWRPITSTRKLKWLSVGDDGDVWGVDGQGNVYRINQALLDKPAQA